MKRLIFLVFVSFIGLAANAQKGKDQKPILFPVLLDDKWGFANVEGRAVISPRFEDADIVNGFYDNLIGIKQSGKWGYVNQKGEVVITPQFYGVGPFVEEIARVTMKTGSNIKVGYINKKGKFIIEPEYDNIAPEMTNFSGGMVLLSKDGKWGYADKKGKVVIDFIYKVASPFNDGLAAVRQNDTSLCGYIDEKGKWVIPAIFKNNTSYSDGIAAITKDGEKWAIIDKKNRAASDTVYEIEGNTWKTYEGMGRVKLHDKTGFVNGSGKLVLTPKFDETEQFSDGLVAVKNEKWGYADKSGNIVIDYKYDETTPFYEGLAAVKYGEKWGFIDKKGKWAVQPSYDEMPDRFYNGLARVKVKALKSKTPKMKIGYINKTGHYVWDLQM